MPDLRRLTHLRQLLIDATDFSDVYGYFMDNFGEAPELLTMGERWHDQDFLDTIEQLGGRVIGKGARLTQPFLLRVAEHGFVHGAFVLGDHIGSVFYFEDIEKGLLALGGRESQGPEQFARFTLARFPTAKRFALN